MAETAERAIVSIATFKMTDESVFPNAIRLIYKSSHSAGESTISMETDLFGT